MKFDKETLDLRKQEQRADGTSTIKEKAVS